MADGFARDVEALATLFTAGGWREVRIEAATFSLLLSTDAAGAGLMPAPRPMEEPSAAPSSRPAAPAPLPTGGFDPSWHAVVAPNLGTFYRSPKPGAAPFVEIGQHVAAGAELCLLEVMKLFTSVTANVGGTVRGIAAADAELVAGGQPLFYLELG